MDLTPDNSHVHDIREVIPHGKQSTREIKQFIRFAGKKPVFTRLEASEK